MATTATTHPPAIEALQLEKRYGEQSALAGLDLLVPQAAFYGLLGPNGAGKTTTVSILTTLQHPTGGSARLLGHDVVREASAVRAAVGIVFQETSLDRELTAREQLDLHARLYRLPERRRRVAEGLALVGLEADADRPVRQLSGGLRRRVEIARGLLHRPRVLFLDEPTLGLDVAARAAIWEHLRGVHARGDTTLFLTTHSMEEADALCERIGILDRGRLVADGAPEALKAQLGGDVAAFVIAREPGAVEALSRVEGVSRVSSEPVSRKDSPAAARLRVTTADGPRRLAALLEAARPFGILEVTLHRPTLEHVFLHHTGHPFEPDLDGPQGGPR